MFPRLLGIHAFPVDVNGVAAGLHFVPQQHPHVLHVTAYVEELLRLHVIRVLPLVRRVEVHLRITQADDQPVARAAPVLRHDDARIAHQPQRSREGNAPREHAVGVSGEAATRGVVELHDVRTGILTQHLVGRRTAPGKVPLPASEVAELVRGRVHQDGVLVERAAWVRAVCEPRGREVAVRPRVVVVAARTLVAKQHVQVLRSRVWDVIAVPVYVYQGRRRPSPPDEAVGVRGRSDRDLESIY